MEFLLPGSIPPECWSILSVDPNTLSAGYSDGHVALYDTRKVYRIFSIPFSPVSCVSPLPSSLFSPPGYSSQAELVAAYKLSSGGVCSLSLAPGRPLLAATQNGAVAALQVSPSSLQFLSSREKAHQGTSWAVRYGPAGYVFSTGSVGDVKLWESKEGGKQLLPHLSSSGSAFGSMAILALDTHPLNSKLFLVCSLDSTLRVGMVGAL